MRRLRTYSQICATALRAELSKQTDLPGGIRPLNRDGSSKCTRSASPKQSGIRWQRRRSASGCVADKEQGSREASDQAVRAEQKATVKLARKQLKENERRAERELAQQRHVKFCSAVLRSWSDRSGS